MADLIFKDFSRKPSVFKYISTSATPENTVGWAVKSLNENITNTRMRSGWCTIANPHAFEEINI